MSEQTTEAPPAAPSGEGSEADRLTSLENKVGQILDVLKGSGGGPGTETDPEEDKIRSAVQKEMDREKAKLKAAETAKAREQASADHADRIAKLEKVTEKQPREYKPVQNWMWRPKEGE